MNLLSRAVTAVATLAVCFLPALAYAQLDAAQLRGSVVDDKGQPIQGVEVEIKYKGETRTPIIKKATTDKKGGFVRVGLKGGDWTLTFRKDGYKTAGLDTYLSIGGLSEIPPVTLAPAPVAAPIAAVAAAAPAADAAQAERTKQLGEAYARALAAVEAGRMDEAEALFKTLADELPNLAEVRYNLGYLYEKRGAKPEAEAEYRKALELQPQNAHALVALAALLDLQGKAAEALALLEASAPRFESDARVQYALGATAFNLGKNAQAEPAFEKVIVLDPANTETLFFLGSIALGRNDVPAAVERLEKFVALAPASSPNLPTATALLQTLRKKK